MSEATTVTAPPPGPGNSQALLASAAALAQSPLESGLDWVAENAPQPQPENQIPSDAGDYARRFEAARAADNPNLATQQAKQAAQQQQQAQPGQPGGESKPESALNWKPRKAQDWQALHEAHNAKVQSLMAEINQLKTGTPATQATASSAASTTQPPPELQARLEALQKERDEYFETVKLVRAEKDPDFVARFDTKRAAAINAAKFAAGGASDKIANILSQPPSDFRDAALEDAIKDFSPSSKARILAAANALTQVDVERQIELETRAKTWEQRQQSEQQRSQQLSQQRTAEMKQNFQKEMKRWQDPESGIPFTIPNDKNNKAVQAIAERAEQIAFGRLGSDKEMSEVALKAATFDHVVAMAVQQAEEYATLKAAYDRVMGVQPDTAGYIASPQVGTGVSNAGAGHGTQVPGSTPLVMQGYADWHQQLEAAKRADAARSRY